MKNENRTKSSISLPELKDVRIPELIYPWPNTNSPFSDQLGMEVQEWLEKDFDFLPPEMLLRYKKQHLHDVATRMSPNAPSLKFMRPAVRYVTIAVLFDDYYESYSYEALDEVRNRLYDIFYRGLEPGTGDNGFFHQFAILRREMLEVLPERFLKWVADGHDRYIRYGMMEEIQYKTTEVIPPLKAYELIREYSVGMHACIYMVDLGTGFSLSQEANDHPAMIRLRVLLNRIIGWQNDFNSLPKEINKPNEVCNIVFVLEREFNISFDEALKRAKKMHDDDLEEFIAICDNLKEFSIYSNEVEEYIYNMKLMISGCGQWYKEITTRYFPDAYTGMIAGNI
ncbi:terpene synthase family protein [Chryseobacterium oranimense]|uniref:terpene synthase family protein n=1 Tax=Chryseobacterium oranimense TaxID=421058 RepID=UPI0031DD0638